MVPKLKGKKETKEEILHQVQKLLEEKGRKTLELTRKLMLESEGKIQSKSVCKALRYFANNYWSDLARPTLMSLVCEAVGGNYESLISIAASIMLITAGIDIHDDVIDKSQVKNERLTVFGKFGRDVALLIGNALMFKGFIQLNLALRNIQPEKAIKVLKIIEDTFFELGDAEALELPFKAKINVNPEKYLQIVRKKAADVEAYTHISALLGEGTKEEIEAMRKYGRILGMLTILRDDLIDMADEKELMHRLDNEIAPLPILYAAQNPKAKFSINAILNKKQKTRKDFQKVLEITLQNRGFALAKKRIHEIARKGILNLRSIRFRKKELKLLINFMEIT